MDAPSDLTCRKPPCPLCSNPATEPFFTHRKRDFLFCPVCDFVFVPPAFHESPEQEKLRYTFHQHSLNDPGYRSFLERLFQPLKSRLAPNAHGLDFGCGQFPTLSVLFEEAGLSCDNYDLYFAPNRAVFEKTYDVLTCSETIEHFARPREEFERFLQRVKPGGWIGIMTQLRDEAPSFENWFYKNDVTHVGFFSRATFHYLAQTYGLRLDLCEQGVILLQLPERSS
ncbi:MAG: class I SAM-dependent methyltransferase [Kiritimatiellaceae bacterium]|nr:class I SAM-dependent methyltransferase [Kiritimatiellaceae bacterium]